jgi:uncharacterized membrane protein
MFLSFFANHAVNCQANCTYGGIVGLYCGWYITYAIYLVGLVLAVWVVWIRPLLEKHEKKGL